jgi:hypothetical protein
LAQAFESLEVKVMENLLHQVIAGKSAEIDRVGAQNSEFLSNAGRSLRRSFFKLEVAVNLRIW